MNDNPVRKLFEDRHPVIFGIGVALAWLPIAIFFGIAAFGSILWDLLAGQRDVYPNDLHEPIYRQRILIGRYFNQSYACRWKVWLATASPAVVMLAIVWFNL